MAKIESVLGAYRKVCPQCLQMKSVTQFKSVSFITPEGKCISCEATKPEYKQTETKDCDIEHLRMQFGEMSRIYRSGLNYELRREAERMTSRAIRKGMLIPMPCEVCGEQYVHAHHPDYAKPLKVRWLCPKHHFAWHTCKFDFVT